MRESVENLVAETARFGLRLHGSVVDGVVTMPSGHTAGSVPAYVSTIAVSGKTGPYGPVHFDNAADVYLKNYAVLSFDETLFNTAISGKSLGKEAVPFVAPSGRVWILAATGNWACNAASFAGTAKRFGVFGKNVDDNAHTVTIANPALGIGDLSACILRLTDATRDGSKRIYRAESGGIAIAWLELTLSESTPTTIGASFAIVRDVTTTKGGYTTQLRVSSTGSANVWRASRGASMTKTASTATTETWLAEPGAEITIDTPASTTDTLHGHLRITGHIFSMLYNDAGALINSTLDVHADVDGTSTLSLSTSGSGTCTVDVVFVGGTPNSTITGAVQIDGAASRSSTITAKTQINVSHGGLSVGSVAYTAVGTSTQTVTARSVGGDGVNYTYHSAGPRLHVLDTGQDDIADHREFKADGVLVKAFATAPISTPTNTTSSGLPDVLMAAGHIYLDVDTTPAPGPSMPPQDALMAQIGVKASHIPTAGGTAFPTLFSRIKRRSNSIQSVPGAMLTSEISGGITTVTVDSAWDSQLIGRNGTLDPTKPAVAASYGGGEVTWDLPTVSEQPVTGEWVRGASISQNVGFV